MSSNEDRRERIDPGRRELLRAIPLAGLLGVGSGAASAAPRGASGTAKPGSGSRAAFPEVVPLPAGFQPEGIVTGRGSTFFAGSVADGAIYRGDLRTGEGDVFVPSTEDRVAIGLSYDRRSDSLFVAGGGTGEAYVYDASTGETAGVYRFTDPGSFVNDVVVTRTAAYFTDSFRPYVYRLPLGPGGRLPDRSDVEEVALGGDFEFVEDSFNANGIDAPPDGEYLIVVNSTTGELYRVDPDSGLASRIDLGGETVTNGDGILLDGRTLYVVRNRLNRIAVVRLDRDATGGDVVGTITDDDFDVPTTVAEFGNALYAVNARFGIDNPDAAAYGVVRVPKRPGC